MKKHILAVAVACLLPVAGFSQTQTGVTLDPPEIKAGDSVKITVNFSVENAINCGLRIHFGDGAVIDYKINQQKDVPLVVPHTYAKAGEYKIMAENKMQGTLFKCGGKNQVVALKVVAPTAGASKKAAAGGPQCPGGWALDRKSVNKKTGAFTCTAAPNTKPVKVACPGDLSYFENERKGLVGCRP